MKDINFECDRCTKFLGNSLQDVEKKAIVYNREHPRLPDMICFQCVRELFENKSIQTLNKGVLGVHYFDIESKSIRRELRKREEYIMQLEKRIEKLENGKK